MIFHWNAFEPQGLPNLPKKRPTAPVECCSHHQPSTASFLNQKRRKRCDARPQAPSVARLLRPLATGSPRLTRFKLKDMMKYMEIQVERSLHKLQVTPWLPWLATGIGHLMPRFRVIWRCNCTKQMGRCLYEVRCSGSTDSRYSRLAHSKVHQSHPNINMQLPFMASWQLLKNLEKAALRHLQVIFVFGAIMCKTAPRFLAAAPLSCVSASLSCLDARDGLEVRSICAKVSRKVGGRRSSVFWCYSLWLLSVKVVVIYLLVSS